MIASDASTLGTLFDWPSLNGAPHEHVGGLCVVGAPTDNGSAVTRGAAHGPTAIRVASQSIEPPIFVGFDWGDVERFPSADLASFLRRLCNAVEILRQKRLCPLILGGDHSISFAPISTLQQSTDACVIWFDAHTDFSPWSRQGAHNHKQVLRRISELDHVGRIIQIGYRGITTEDERNLGPKVEVVTSSQARALDEYALMSLIPKDMPCYVSIDIDVVDPFFAPGTSVPVPDGLSPAQLGRMLASITRNRLLVGIDIVEVNPRIDRGNSTSVVAAGLLREIANNWHYQLEQCRGLRR